MLIGRRYQVGVHHVSLQSACRWPRCIHHAARHPRGLDTVLRFSVCLFFLKTSRRISLLDWYSVSTGTYKKCWPELCAAILDQAGGPSSSNWAPICLATAARHIDRWSCCVLVTVRHGAKPLPDMIAEYLAVGQRCISFHSVRYADLRGNDCRLEPNSRHPSRRRVALSS
jgi:hypothetical protein